MKGRRLGFALTGSFCTFDTALASMRELVAVGASLLPVMSYNAAQTDTRFWLAKDFRAEVEHICGARIIESIVEAEPIGPKGLCDLMIVAPCTGNTLAKLAAGIIDTPVLMAVKSHLRGGRPVLLAISTNDGLSGAAANIGALLNRRHIYFVPFRQDAPEHKPRSLTADFGLLRQAAEAALAEKQLQPVLLQA